MLAPTRPYGVGVDIHSQFAEIVVLTPTASRDELSSFALTSPVYPDSLLQAKQRILAHLALQNIAVTELMYAIESTATYHYPVVRAWGGKPIVVNPGLASQYKARKTDKFDARLLAHQMLSGLFETSFVADATTEELRLLLRSRRKWLAQRARCFSTIAIRLSQWYCPLSHDSPRDRTIRAIIEDCGRGSFTSLHPSFVHANCVPPRIWGHLLKFYAEADHASELIDYFEKQAEEIADPEFLKRMQTIPGVGKLTAIMWLAEIEPASRFPTGRALAAYLGLDPTPMVSAGKVVKTACRMGKRNIHSALIQAAHVAIRTDTPIGHYGQKALKRGKNRKTVATMVARKIAMIMYACSLKGKDYDPQKNEPTDGPDS